MPLSRTPCKFAQFQILATTAVLAFMVMDTLERGTVRFCPWVMKLKLIRFWCLPVCSVSTSPQTSPAHVDGGAQARDGQQGIERRMSSTPSSSHRHHPILVHRRLLRSTRSKHPLSNLSSRTLFGPRNEGMRPTSPVSSSIRGRASTTMGQHSRHPSSMSVDTQRSWHPRRFGVCWRASKVRYRSVDDKWQRYDWDIGFVVAERWLTITFLRIPCWILHWYSVCDFGFALNSSSPGYKLHGVLHQSRVVESPSHK